MSDAAPEHLYVHVPFCAHRCGYCDFVTVSASPHLHGAYVDALRREHEVRGLGSRYQTVFVGGGTPTLLHLPQLERLLAWLRGMVVAGGELTVECNPETVTADLATVVATHATRVSLGAQSMSDHVLGVLERRATPAQVRGATRLLREAGVEQLNLDVIWGVPGQGDADLARDLEALLELGPDHLSAYELDFKPGTRLTRAWGDRDAAVGEASDGMYELVVDRLEGAGFAWYETANFARGGMRCRHNVAIWRGEPYAGIGIGAVGTTAAGRRRNRPSLPRYLAAGGEGGAGGGDGGDVPHDVEPLDAHTRRLERVMLGLRLAEGVVLRDADVGRVIDRDGLAWLCGEGLAAHAVGEDGRATLRLSRRGRMLTNSVLDRLLVL